MSLRRSTLPLLALFAAAGLARAQEPPPSRVPEPQVLHQVTEDDNVRIEELRVRGQTKRLVVKPKIKGLEGYEIAAPEPGRSPTEDPKAGKQIWLSINF